MITLLSPAKINWFLHIEGKRSDGYHSIFSILQGVSLYDELSLDHSHEIELVADIDIPVKENIVMKAAELLREKTQNPRGARIRLTKNIPVQAGLGGGSSNAAYTLRGLNRLWNCGLDKSELSMIASELGSDVPFFIYGNTASVEGRGEIVHPLTVKGRFHLLLIKPPYHISTGWAYNRIDECGSGNAELSQDDHKHMAEQFCHALETRDFGAIGHFMRNDIEESIQKDFPSIGIIKGALREAGAEAAMLSGSGSVLFGLFRDRESSLKAFNVMKKIFPDCWCRAVETII